MSLVIESERYKGQRGGHPERGELPEPDRRTFRVSVRLSPVELDDLDSRRGRLQRGSWMRAAALLSAPPRIPSLNPEGVRLLSTIANNVNQIAHRVNSGQSAAGLQEALAEVQSLRRILIGADS